MVGMGVRGIPSACNAVRLSCSPGHFYLWIIIKVISSLTEIRILYNNSG